MRLLLTVVAALLAVPSKDACRLHGWDGTNAYAWACYSGWTALFGARGFAENAFALFAAGADPWDASMTALSICSGRNQPLVVSVVGAALSWLAVNLPMVIMKFEAWNHFDTFAEVRGAGLSPFWHIYNVTVSVGPGTPELGGDGIETVVAVLFRNVEMPE